MMENTDRACVVPGIHRIAFLSAISFGVAVFFSDAVDKMYTRHLAEYVRRDDHSDRWSVTLSALASDKDLRRLPAQKVRGVSFDGSSVTAKGLTALQQLNELSHISFYNVEVGSREIEAILRIPRLTSLHIDGTAIDIADMREISQRQWRFFSLTDADLTDEHVALLGEQRELRSLSISDNPSLTDDSLRVISQFNSLQWLSLDNTSITPKGLEQLAGMHLLELEVPIDAMTDAGFAPYIRATKPLPRYALYDWRILDDALAFLPMETNAISLHRMEITDQGLDNLTRLKALYELDLTGTEITDTGLIYLAELPDLTRLSLCDTNITDDGLTHLVEIPNLVSLSLDRT
ncbi:MAG: hypothetical protein QGG36_05505 [Pirellulaceae bacterium]|nr:hypothetical protein [Pirellulaceae bacterium]